MYLEIYADELRAALREIEKAEASGFMYCSALLEARSLRGHRIALKYDELIERAHPTDENFNWGVGQEMSKRFNFVDGKLVKR